MPVTRVHETGIKSDSLTNVVTEIEQAKEGKSSLLERINSFTDDVDEVAAKTKILAARTNLKLNHYKNAVREVANEMIVDTFDDASGIDAGASSNYTYDDAAADEGVYCTDGTTAVLVSTPETIAAVPEIIFLTTQDEPNTGSLAYEFSLDGGATYTAIDGEGVVAVPQGTAVSDPVSFVMKATITGDARLNGWAYGWK